MVTKGIRFLGFGKALPKGKISNEDLAKTVDTSDEWIYSRVGIRNRHVIEEGESVLTLGTEAAKKALAQAGIEARDIGLIIVATFSAQMAMPNTAAMLQDSLGLGHSQVMAFDLNAACTGFVFALITARALLESMDKKYALVVGAETISPLLDRTDRSTCVLFGDGAGAAVLELDPNRSYGEVVGAKGDKEKCLVAPGVKSASRFLTMKGNDVYRFAVKTIPDTLEQLAQENNLQVKEFDWVVCHQANVRILDAVAKRLDLPRGRFMKALENYGNTSAASIPIALADMAERGLLKAGQKIAMVGFGGGLTWGGIYVEY